MPLICKYSHPQVLQVRQLSTSLILPRSTSTSDLFFPGTKCQYTLKLDILTPETDTPIPVYRVMDTKGNIIDSSHDPNVRLRTLIISIFIE